MNVRGVSLGVIADDLTGATDIAIALVSAGFRTTIVTEDFLDPQPGADAVVVAMTTRSVPAAEAVDRSVRALTFLRGLGARRFYFKYCSTFDSTVDGNIGPVLDAALELLDATATVVVPSFPATGRTVYQGHLFVGARLLDDSHMRNHPLNPMTDSYLPRVLQAQSQSAVGHVPWQVVRAGEDALLAALRQRIEAGEPLLVVDALDADDLAAIASATAEMTLLSGGSGLAAALKGPHRGREAKWDAVARPHIVLSGSASAQTRRQVQAGLKAGAGLHLNAGELARDFSGAVDRIVEEALGADVSPFVIYATGPDDDVDPVNAELFERAFAALARQLVRRGVAALVVAGGETSGSVTEELGVRSLQVRKVIGAGVAWADAKLASGRVVKLALKSGNFGPVDMFETLWRGSSDVRG